MDPGRKMDRRGRSGRAIRAYYERIADYMELALAARGDVAFWRRIARRRPGRALEVGAGTGRITRLLAPDRELVVAVDLSPEMLRRARRTLSGFPSVRLVASDIRELHLAARFDLAVAANDPLAHLLDGRDRDRALERIAAHLSPGGRFLLDALWLPPGAAREAASPDGRRLERRVEREGKELEVRELWRCDPRTRCCRVRYTYVSGGDVLAEAATEMRPWSPGELRRRLGRAGLRTVALHGDYAGRPWSPETAEILLVEAER